MKSLHERVQINFALLHFSLICSSYPRCLERFSAECLKGTLSRQFLRFGVKNVVKFKLNVFHEHRILLECQEKEIE